MYVKYTTNFGETENARRREPSPKIRVSGDPAACPLQWTRNLIENIAMIELQQGAQEIDSRLR